jgi:hypothetical protein
VADWSYCFLGSGDPGPEWQGDLRGGRRQEERHPQLRHVYVAQFHHGHGNRVAGPQGVQHRDGRWHAQVHCLLEQHNCVVRIVNLWFIVQFVICIFSNKCVVDIFSRLSITHDSLNPNKLLN